MDPEEYEKIFGYLSDKKYPNDIKESDDFHASVESISQLWNLRLVVTIKVFHQKLGQRKL
jgi:hypothetical protein